MTGSEPLESDDDNPRNPQNPRICYCMKIHRAELAAAIAGGARTVEELGRETTAGTGCGTCRSELVSLLRELLPGEIVDAHPW